jgi:hypothetical protein
VLGDRGDEGGTGAIPTQAGSVRRFGQRPDRRRLGRLGCRVPGRHPEPDDVDEVAGPPVGDRPEQGRRLGREHRLGSDGAFEEGQCALVLGAPAALDDVRVDEPAGEPDAYPRAGPYLTVEGRRDLVVEQPIEMRQRDVDVQPRDRIVSRRLAARPGSRRPPARHAPFLPVPADGLDGATRR